MKDFSQKVALISGAGSGIGRALSIELADMGCNLALVDWNKESLEETKQLLRKKMSLYPHIILILAIKKKYKLYQTRSSNLINK